MSEYDVVIIGGGPGGYVAAIRGRQLGLKVALIEKEELGGVCLNWGCIPTKALLRNAEVIDLLKSGKTYGFSLDSSGLKIDYSAAQRRSRKVSSRLVKGVNYLMKKNGVDVYKGTGVITKQRKVEIQKAGQILECKNIIIATGSKANVFPGIEIDGNKILTAHEGLEMKELPQKMFVVGAGAIGMEFAFIWNSYGVDVTILEMEKHILPTEDTEISSEMKKHFEKIGIRIINEAKIETINATSTGVELSADIAGKKQNFIGDKVLIAAGVRANSSNLGLEGIGVKVEQGFVQIDESMCTNVPGVYAIGDVTGKLALAHVASMQGILAIECIAGNEIQPLNYYNMPRCTYCVPESASVGMTEKQALDQGYDVGAGKFPFSANGKAIGLGEDEGLVKIVKNKKDGEILGVHMVGPHVTELIAGPTGLIALECTVEELARIVHPHPSLSEVVMEAAHAASGHAIHI